MGHLASKHKRGVFFKEKIVFLQQEKEINPIRAVKGELKVQDVTDNGSLCSALSTYESKLLAFVPQIGLKGILFNDRGLKKLTCIYYFTPNGLHNCHTCTYLYIVQTDCICTYIRAFYRYRVCSVNLVTHERSWFDVFASQKREFQRVPLGDYPLHRAESNSCRYCRNAGIVPNMETGVSQTRRVIFLLFPKRSVPDSQTKSEYRDKCLTL